MSALEIGCIERESRDMTENTMARRILHDDVWVGPDLVLSVFVVRALFAYERVVHLAVAKDSACGLVLRGQYED